MRRKRSRIVIEAPPGWWFQGRKLVRLEDRDTHRRCWSDRSFRTLRKAVRFLLNAPAGTELVVTRLGYKVTEYRSNQFHTLMDALANHEAETCDADAPLDAEDIAAANKAHATITAAISQYSETALR